MRDKILFQNPVQLLIPTPGIAVVVACVRNRNYLINYLSKGGHEPPNVQLHIQGKFMAHNESSKGLLYHVTTQLLINLIGLKQITVIKLIMKKKLKESRYN